MNGTTADPEYDVRNMLQRYEVVMLDDLSTGQPDFSWAQLFLAIDQLSRKNLIALRRVGQDYQILSMNQSWPLGQACQPEELAAQH